ncbi:hypothetical protein CAter282_1556 [Collimonas arenae]|uniref:Uncharacterized protein n=1 Tax=Collimonas arenae TaxID=279058 RepID=A0A127PNQ3_9BURK|nr:hypothetical protein [Collimonas arenae]AMO99440.1 hypothetical protein CAter10_1683 [Collimonas arenae]AMP09342.1 hypothetical protein CAter282_1556 [Collimonas arenae]
MILTISSRTSTVGPSDPLNSLAASIARRRARAGRDVLFIYKKTAAPQNGQQPDIAAADGWVATAIKTAAELREVGAADIAAELASASMQYHDVIVDMPKLEDASSLYVLATAQLAIFSIQASQWHTDRHLLSTVHAARTWNPDLPVLLLVDDMQSAAGQALVSTLSERIENIRFLQMSASRTDNTSVGSLYHAIYAGCAAVCA